MRIAVCLDTSVGGLTPRAFVGSEPTDAESKIYLTDADRYAIDAACRARSQPSDEVVGLAVVPQSAATALRDALALGVDRVVTISPDGDQALDLVDLTHTLHLGLMSIEVDLVVFGPQGEQAGLPIWASVAQAMGIPSVANVSQFSRDETGLKATFQSQLGNLTVRVPVPGVMSVAAGDSQMRLVSMRDRVAARSKPISSIPLATDVSYVAPSKGEAVLVGQVERANQREVRVVKDVDDPVGAVLAFLAERGFVE
jgi:electron transfer flavoprotein beta subunit